MNSPTPRQLSQVGSLDELYRQLAQIRMGAGWDKPTPSLWAEPRKNFRPYHWSYAQARGALDAAGRLINTELAERRNLILANPAEDYATARTIVAAYQMIMPGERARSHRHSPNALRLIIDAEPGAYTIVNGQKLEMLPGDVLLTPNWAWHGHSNEGRACAYWLDMLDVPLVQLLEPMFFEHHPEGFEEKAQVANNSPMHFCWKETERRLNEAETLSNGASSVQIAFGDPAFDTMALSMIKLKPGTEIAFGKVTANNVFGVVRGEGVTKIDGEEFHWRRGDVVVVPAWRAHVHSAKDDTILFRVTDEPALKKLGFLRAENGNGSR
jgi:gentisate 1,2-dioxygenase